MDSDRSDFDPSRAELFEALGHPIRMRILQCLDEAHLSFSELKRRVGIESSGHLQFHLEKLNGLIKVNPGGNYALTDDGKEALRLMENMDRTRGIGVVARARQKMRPIVWGLVFTLLGAFFSMLLPVVYFTFLEKVALGGDGITTTYFRPMPVPYLALIYISRLAMIFSLPVAVELEIYRWVKKRREIRNKNK